MAAMENSTDPAGSTPEPGERRRLERPPSERFAATADPVDAEPPESTAEPSSAGRLGRGAAVALGGAAMFVLLGGPVSVTAGLVAVAGVVGWLVGSIVRSPGRAVALAVGSTVLGLLGIWFFALSEGGTLGLVEYLAEVQGVLVPVELAAAAVMAAASAR
jgi:hypothetical protein